MTTATRIAEGLAEVMSAAIKADGKSQRKVADETGIPLVTLSRRLTGRSPFTVPEVAAIAELLDVSVVDLFLRVERSTHDAA